MGIKVTKLFFLSIALLILIPQVMGCSSNNSQDYDYEQLLLEDATLNLKSTYAGDFTRITIIRGALYKFLINPDNPQQLGTTIGAVEATVFPEQYELSRFDRLENLPATMRKQIISQPMLGITLKKREALNHIYNAVLKPLSTHIDKGGPIGPQERAVIDSLIILLDTLSENYSYLSDKDTDFNSSEAQRIFISMQHSFRELQKLELINKPKE